MSAPTRGRTGARVLERGEPSTVVTSPINYTGGKRRLVPALLRLFGDLRGRTFVDAFAGGLTVGLNAAARRVVYNDADPAAVRLARYFAARPAARIESAVEALVARYGLSDSRARGYAAYGTDSSHGLAAANKAAYARLRADFNERAFEGDWHPAALFALVIFGFNNQIRFNEHGRWNLPVGKRDFNARVRRNLRATVARLAQQDHEIRQGDFRDLDPAGMERPFVYCDPPYLLGGAGYNERGAWSVGDDGDLRAYLADLDRAGVPFALSNLAAHKGRVHGALLAWASRSGFRVAHLPRSYANASYHASHRAAASDEVLITNY